MYINYAIGIMQWSLKNQNQLPRYYLFKDTSQVHRIKELISLHDYNLIGHFNTHKYKNVYVLQIPGVNKRFIGFDDDRLHAKLDAAEAAANYLKIEHSTLPKICTDKIVLRDYQQALDAILREAPNKIICCLLCDNDAITAYTSATYTQHKVYMYDRRLGDIWVANLIPSYKQKKAIYTLKLKNAVYTPDIIENLNRLSKKRKDLLPKIYAAVCWMLYKYQEALRNDPNNQDLVSYASAFCEIDSLLAKMLYVEASQATYEEEANIGKIDNYMEKKGFERKMLKQYKIYLPKSSIDKQNRGAKEDK